MLCGFTKQRGGILVILLVTNTTNVNKKGFWNPYHPCFSFRVINVSEASYSVVLNFISWKVKQCSFEDETALFIINYSGTDAGVWLYINISFYRCFHEVSHLPRMSGSLNNWYSWNDNKGENRIRLNE